MFHDVTILAEAADPGTRLIVHWQDAPPVLSPEAAAYIEKRWEQYVADARAAGHRLFNGPVTRVCSAAASPGMITLNLGPADYKTFLVTALRDYAWFEAHAPEAITPALGNSALLTRGRQALLGLRSAGVSAYPGRYHLFGGVLESLGTAELPATAEGLEGHLLQELREEIGLERAELEGEPRPLVLVVDHLLHQPELIWRWEVRVPLESLLPRLHAGEHVSALVLEKAAMTAELWERLTPCARQAWRLWNPQ